MSRITILRACRHTAWSDGSKELFDCAAQGRIDAFFLGGGQIDGEANINLIGIGAYPTMKKRFPCGKMPGRMSKVIASIFQKACADN